MVSVWVVKGLPFGKDLRERGTLSHSTQINTFLDLCKAFFPPLSPPGVLYEPVIFLFLWFVAHHKHHVVRISRRTSTRPIVKNSWVIIFEGLSHSKRNGNRPFSIEFLFHLFLIALSDVETSRRSLSYGLLGFKGTLTLLCCLVWVRAIPF